MRKAEVSKTEGAEIVESKPQRTADQIIQDDRCVIPRELFDKAQIIASERK